MNVAVAGACAFTPLGIEWRALASVAGSARSVALEPPVENAAERMATRLMSRSARLAHWAVRGAVRDAGWLGVEDVGVYMGVGASGGSIEQIEAMVGPSLVDGELSWEAFGSAGLRAGSPLFAFQLMNNFSMCHAAMLSGTRGPNHVVFSRGPATFGALEEAVWAIETGECERALAGAADTALDPVTAAEIARRSPGSPLDAGEASAMLALTADPRGAVAFVRHCNSHAAPLPAGDVVRTETVAEAFGDSLAATPAVACAVALSMIADGAARVSVVGGDAVITFEAPT